MEPHQTSQELYIKKVLNSIGIMRTAFTDEQRNTAFKFISMIVEEYLLVINNSCVIKAQQS